MLQIAARFLLLSGLLVGQAARVELRHGEQEAVEELQRYRALDENEFQRFMAGENVSLLATSFSEDDTDLYLPREWQSKLSVVKKLGEGSFGKVFQCKVLCENHQETYVSVKLIVKKEPIVRQEIKVLESMRGVSDFCISAVGEPPFIDNSDGYWIMMPYMNGGELHDFLEKCRRNRGCINGDAEGRKDWTQVDRVFTTSYILGLFHDMVQGVKALHDKAGLHHIDLKPANVMLNCEGGNRCFAAVIDLGLACDPTKNGCGASGTPLYIPREVYLSDRAGMQDAARDVWALGLILYQLLYGNLPPFFRTTRDQLYNKIISYDVNTDGNVPHTQKVDTLVRAMLHMDWKKRPSLSSILAYVKGIVRDTVPVDNNAVAMVQYTPVQRYASVVIPTCLDQKETTTTTTYRYAAAEGFYQPSGAVHHHEGPPRRPPPPPPAPQRRPPPPVPTTSSTPFHFTLQYDNRRRYNYDDRRRHDDGRRHFYDAAPDQQYEPARDRHGRPLVSPVLDEPTTTAFYDQPRRLPPPMHRRLNELVPGLRLLGQPTPAPREYNPNDYAPPAPREYNPNDYAPPGQPPIRLLHLPPRPSFLEAKARPHDMQEETEQDPEE